MAECFVIYSEKIEGRFDPLYLKNISSIKDVKTKYSLVSIGELLREKVQYGANEIAIDGDPKKDVRYIRITDIDEFGNLKDDVWQTAKYVDDKYLLEEDDILFARSGATAGKTFIFKNEFGKAIFAGYLIRFKIDKTKANPKYVFFYTQLSRYNLWVKSIQRPSGQPNINSEEFKSFEIPLPSMEVQNKIVQLMERAYLSRESKEAESQKILDSFDDYIRDELGINMPELQDKTCYSVSFEETQDKRFDVYYYQPKFEEVEKAIKNGKYPSFTLNHLLTMLVNGLDFRGFSEEGLRYVRVGNIKPNKFDFLDVKFIPHIKILKDIKLEIGDLLVTRKGSFGIATVVNEEHKNIVISSEIFRIKLKTEKVYPFYLSALLNTKLFRLIFDRIKTGGIMGHISQEALVEIKIPLPPIVIQNKIAEEVKKRMQKAEQLYQEARELVEKAKVEVEKLILGK